MSRLATKAPAPALVEAVATMPVLGKLSLAVSFPLFAIRPLKLWIWVEKIGVFSVKVAVPETIAPPSVAGHAGSTAPVVPAAVQRNSRPAAIPFPPAEGRIGVTHSPTA